MFADYFAEFCGDETLETPMGFAVYRFLDAEQVYIVHIYVLPEARESGAASAIADAIVEAAKKRGCKRLMGTVVPSAKHSARSMRVLLNYGMTPVGIEGNMVVFGKDI
jgi:GNAT superfamily N-acetyltransferase